MRLGVFRQLADHPGPERGYATVPEFHLHLAVEAMEHVTPGAPVIRQVAGGIPGHAQAQVAPLLRGPAGVSTFTGVLDGFDAGPVGEREEESGSCINREVLTLPLSGAARKQAESRRGFRRPLEGLLAQSAFQASSHLDQSGTTGMHISHSNAPV